MWLFNKPAPKVTSVEFVQIKTTKEGKKQPSSLCLAVAEVIARFQQIGWVLKARRRIILIVCVAKTKLL